MDGTQAMRGIVVSCYLLGQLKGTTIVALRVCGEPSWDMTRHHRDRTEYVVLLESRSGSFQQSFDDLRKMYPSYLPLLSKLLPFPR